MMFPETTQIWGKEFPGSMFHDAWELLFFTIARSLEYERICVRFIRALPPLYPSQMSINAS
jgi:hypothetical protein